MRSPSRPRVATCESNARARRTSSFSCSSSSRRARTWRRATTGFASGGGRADQERQRGPGVRLRAPHVRMMLSRKIGIDLGTSTVRIYVKGEGIVINEPSGVATLYHLIGKANGRPRLFKPDVVMSVPSAVTSGERRAVTEAAMAAGARQVWLVGK